MAYPRRRHSGTPVAAPLARSTPAHPASSHPSSHSSQGHTHTRRPSSSTSYQAQDPEADESSSSFVVDRTQQQLAPPRPFFLADSTHRYSSASTASADSDSSDVELSPPSPAYHPHPHPQPQTRGAGRHHHVYQYQPVHTRRQSSIAMSAQSHHHEDSSSPDHHHTHSHHNHAADTSTGTSHEATGTGSDSLISEEPRSLSPLSPPLPLPANARRNSSGSASASASGTGSWSPSALYQDASNAPLSPSSPSPMPTSPGSANRHLPTRPPPSSFAFPFQAYPGNPDPIVSARNINNRRRSGSVESITASASAAVSGGQGYPTTSSNGHGSNGHGSGSEEMYHPLSPGLSPGLSSSAHGHTSSSSNGGALAHRGSLTELRKPFAPFMASSSNPGAGGSSGSLHSDYGNANGSGSGASTPLTRNGSAEVLHGGIGGIGAIGGYANGGIGRNGSSSDLYRQSAAANMSGGVAAPGVVPIGDLPRNASTHSFRAPFLSPASRPTSSLWSPPSYANQHYSSLAASHNSPSGSTTALPMSPIGLGMGNGKEKEGTYMGLAANGSTILNGPSPYAAHLSARKPPLPSTRLAAPLTKDDKPWLASRQPRTRSSWLLTFACILLGAAGAALICWDGVRTVVKLDDARLCSVLDSSFKGASGLDTNAWNREVQAGGYGTGSFEMMTGLGDNLKFTASSGMLLYPTLTSEVLQGGAGAVLSGGRYTLQGCTVGNGTSPATSNNRLTSAPGNVQADQAADAGCSSSAGGNGGNAVVRPVMSARVNTKGKVAVRYGKVEVKARMPVGDWLWPSISLLPVKDAYGPWPLSGEMQLVAARGNGPTYPSQGNNFVRSALTYGPLSSLTRLLFGWYSLKRSSYAAAFHTYTLEWTEDFIRVYVDSRVQSTLLIETPEGGKGKKKGSFWDRAGFPQTAMNATTGKTVVVEDVWSQGPRNAPFDQDFYLAIGLAAGGTSGWFPDGDGGKPWFDSSASAMRDFAKAQSTWAATWPQDEQRGLAIESVKVWSLCK